jgi:hypothetical protein
MKFLLDLMRILFPFRSHLLLEIEYLRAQLASRGRKIDELQEMILEIRKPVVKERVEPKPVSIPVHIAPWKARLPQRGPDDYEPEPSISQGSDAGSEVQVAVDGPAVG